MDIAHLLTPINADFPGGVDMSFSPEVDAIQEMRREDDPSLDQGEWVTALKSADWVGVAHACEAVLATRSKDLRVAGWLADAWARLRGFEGLADGLGVTVGLVENYWDQLHPLPEDADPEQRIGNLGWLAIRVVQLVPSIPLVVNVERSSTATDIAAARSRRLADATNPKPPVQRSGNDTSTGPALTLELVWRDVTSSGREAARARRAHVTRARSALARLQTAVESRLGDDAPSFMAARGALDGVLDELTRLERECHLAETPGPDSPAGDDAIMAKTVDTAHAATVRHAPGHIETRGQALTQLRLVAEFFRATEPHSPVAYLADKAVRWSEMPLHEWLRAVVKDGASLAHLEDMLGVDKIDSPLNP